MHYPPRGFDDFADIMFGRKSANPTFAKMWQLAYHSKIIEERKVSWSVRKPKQARFLISNRMLAAAERKGGPQILYGCDGDEGPVLCQSGGADQAHGAAGDSGAPDRHITNV